MLNTCLIAAFIGLATHARKVLAIRQKCAVELSRIGTRTRAPAPNRRDSESAVRESRRRSAVEPDGWWWDCQGPWKPQHSSPEFRWPAKGRFVTEPILRRGRRWQPGDARAACPKCYERG